MNWQVIEELGDWISDAFLRHTGKNSADDKVLTTEKPASSPRRTAFNNKQPSSPITSETETDDFGITFVVKKDKRTSSPGRGSIDERSESTVVDLHGLGGEADDKKKADTEEVVKKDMSESDGKEYGPVEAGKINGSRHGGQTISESELMRRRRLLDSHIFE